MLRSLDEKDADHRITVPMAKLIDLGDLPDQSVRKRDSATLGYLLLRYSRYDLHAFLSINEEYY